jgi:hypothetical protein
MPEQGGMQLTLYLHMEPGHRLLALEQAIKLGGMVVRMPRVKLQWVLLHHMDLELSMVVARKLKHEWMLSDMVVVNLLP